MPVYPLLSLLEAFEPSTDEQINLVREAFFVITSIASSVEKSMYELSILSLTKLSLEAINFRLMNGLLDHRLQDIVEDAEILQSALLGHVYVEPVK